MPLFKVTYSMMTPPIFWCRQTPPCFTTDYGQLRGGYPERVNIPLADKEAHVTFYFLNK